MQENRAVEKIIALEDLAEKKCKIYSRLLTEPTLAKQLGITAHAIAKTIHSHPTMHEGIMEAAESAMGAAIHL